MDIKLLGYKPIVVNRLYEKDEIKPIRDGEVILLKKMLYLKRYQQASADLVVNYLQGKAKDLKKVKVDTPGNWTDLEEEIINLDSNFRTGLIKGNEMLLRFVREHTSATSKDLLRVYYAKFPADLVKNAQESRVILRLDWYDRVASLKSLFKKGLGEQWRADLPFENKFPQAWADYYKQNMGGRYWNEVFAEEINDYFDTLAQGITTQDEFEEIEIDNSLAQSLETLTLQPVKRLQETSFIEIEENYINKALISRDVLRRAFGNKEKNLLN